MVRLLSSTFVSGAVAVVLSVSGVSAQEDWRATYTLFGTQGLIDMPSAVPLADGEVVASASGFGENQRGTFTFQILPRLTGSFRYSFIDDYDRSFDLQYQLIEEGRYSPAFAVGLRDFIGTGRFSSEYVVATKTLGPNIRVTGGIGWGRLGSLDGFTNPLGVLDERFETRPDDSVDTGGTVLSNQFFRGDAALFGGVEWQVSDEWTLLAEYSSDAYTREERLTEFERNSPMNFGVTWEPNESFQLGAYYLYGSEIGVSATVIIDPTTRRAPSGFDPAPIPVAARGQNPVAAQTWNDPQIERASISALGTVLALDGFELQSAEVVGSAIRVRYENTTFRAEAQGVGRVARILTQAAPLNVDTFILEPTRRGIPLSSVTIRRSDMEVLENTSNATALSFDRAIISDTSQPAPATSWDDPTPAFLWGLTPYAEASLFDGDDPLRGDVGVEATFQYEIQPNLIFAGAFRQRIAGNRDEVGSISASTLPDVRRTALRYGAESGNGIENLFLSHYGRPGTNLYSRVSAGYFERNFGGVSGELLWKPVDSRLAIGAEVNYTLLRDYDLGFGFRPACSGPRCLEFVGDDYDIVTGHVSAYYEFENGFRAQVDIGRYLAGDVGATFSLDREFENGWKVGAYFTLTDVPFDDFGEGSFDKGVRISVPLDWAIGNPTRETIGASLSSLSRDGGARLRVDGRLYNIVQDGHAAQLEDNWGRFWR